MNKDFINELIDRFKLPWKHFAFKSYFIWIVIMFGGIGIGLTIYEELRNSVTHVNIISKTIATTFVAIIASSLVDLNLSYNIKNVPSLIINSIGFIAVSILLLILSFNLNGNWSLLPAISGYFLALIIWILANADNDKLSDDSYLQNITKKVKELKTSLDDLD
jgi:hypothetical protein